MGSVFIITYMNKRLLILVFSFLFAVSIPALANNITSDEEDKRDTKEEKKDTKKTNASPDVPGSLVIEVAKNILTNAPESMRSEWWASWTINVYYLYELPFGESSFSFNPGFGFGMETYRFQDEITLTTTLNDFNTEITPLTTYIPEADSYKRSFFNATYLDIPFEFRWYADKSFKRKSFKVAVGGKVGFRIDSKTKVVYTDNDQTKKRKQKENFNIISPRYGAYARVGFGAISLYYYYSITEFFQNKRGPEETRARNMMVGISISGF